jgi:signal transduction histidine kinase
VVSHAVAVTIFMIAMWPVARNDDEAQLGPGVAIALLRDDLINVRGKIAVRPNADVIELARRSPSLWFMVRDGARQLDFGPVPDQARRLFGTLSGVAKSVELGNIGQSGRAGDASIAVADTGAGHVVIAAGGVRNEAITFADWLHYLSAENLLLIPLLFALFTLVGGLIAIPLVLRSLRPTAQAAAQLDGSDLQLRLPEAHVVKELLPVVRGFNAALDRLAEGFERRRRFIADVAHELRTPLAVLNMHVETLPDGPYKPELQRTVYRLGQMVGQMLDAERLALAGRKRERVDLVQLARDVVADVAPLAIANGYTIGFTSTADQVTVDGDAHAISRAIANLLGNAIAHGGGAGAIEVRIAANGAVDVADEGPGIAPEERERIFEPFHRERWDKDGCGLGLHLVREIMHAHGGNARLLSAAPGAVFRLEFPTHPPLVS